MVYKPQSVTCFAQISNLEARYERGSIYKKFFHILNILMEYHYHRSVVSQLHPPFGFSNAVISLECGTHKLKYCLYQHRERIFLYNFSNFQSESLQFRKKSQIFRARRCARYCPFQNFPSYTAHPGQWNGIQKWKWNTIAITNRLLLHHDSQFEFLQVGTSTAPLYTPVVGTSNTYTTHTSLNHSKFRCWTNPTHTSRLKGFSIIKRYRHTSYPTRGPVVYLPLYVQFLYDFSL